MNAGHIIRAISHGVKNVFRIHDMAINALGMATTISGRILYPLVSSSKNLNRPALEAGRGADFLLLMDIVS